MVRAAAKNHEHVYVVVDPADYSQLVEVLSGKQSADEVSRWWLVSHQQKEVCMPIWRRLTRTTDGCHCLWSATGSRVQETTGVEGIPAHGNL